MKNNQGFTLVELIATIVILGVVLSITGFAITTVITNARQRNYDLLITDIKSAAELYYQECTYMSTVNDLCTDGKVRRVTLGDLVKYGYLSSNDTTEGNTTKVIHPDNEKDISYCQIDVIFNNGKVTVTPYNPAGSCPREY